MTAGQDLVAHFVDECLEQGRPEMVRMKGHMAKRASELLEADVPLDEVKLAITEFVRRRARSPMALAEISVELARNQSPVPEERPEVRRRTKDWITRNGWPTGARFSRGTHSGTYVYDPLGTERLPIGYDWPYSKPSFDEIAAALARSGEAGGSTEGGAPPATQDAA